MTDSDNGQPKTPEQAYIDSWKYTRYNLVIPTAYSFIGGVAGGFAGAMVGGVVAGPFGAALGAKIFASMGAGAASKLASTLDKEGVGKELEQNIFIYKAHGHEDWNEYFHAKSKEGSELSGPQKTLNSVLDYFKKGDVFDELQDLVSAREVVEGRKGSNLESLINSGIWTEGNKTFIKGQIAQIQQNPENTKNLNDIELLSELYANLKLKLYDRTNISDAQEIGLAAVTGAAVGGVGGAVGMIPINNVFADRAVITGARASTSGAMSWLLGEKMSWSQLCQTFVVSEVGAESGAALGVAAHNEWDQYQLNEYRQDVTKELHNLSHDAQQKVLSGAGITIGGTDPDHSISLISATQDELKKLKLSITEHNAQSEQHTSSGGVGTKEDLSRTDSSNVGAPERRLDQGPATASEALEKLHNNVMDGNVPLNITATLKNIALHIKTHDEACKLLDTILATHNGEARVVHSESNNQTHIDYCADPDKAAVILDYIASSEALSKLVESDKGLHRSFVAVYHNIELYNMDSIHGDIIFNHDQEVHHICDAKNDASDAGFGIGSTGHSDKAQLADLRALANVIQKHGDSDKQYWTLEGSDVFREQRAIERLKLGVSEMDGEPIKWGVLQTAAYDGILSPKELQDIIDSKDGWNALEKIESNHHHMSNLFAKFVNDDGGQLKDSVNRGDYLDAVNAYIGKLDDKDSDEWKEIFGQLGGVGDLSEEKKAMYLDTLKSSVEDGKLTPDILKDIIGGDNGWKDLKEIAGDDNLCKIFNSLLDNNQLNDDMINKYMDHLGHNIQDQAQFDFFKKLQGDEGITLTEVTRKGIGQMVHQYEGNQERFIGVVAAALAAACCIGKAASAAVSDDRIPNSVVEDARIEDNIPFFYIRREGIDSTIDTSQITAVGEERIFIMQQDRGSKDAGDYLSREGSDYFTTETNSYAYAKGMKMVNHVLQKEVNIVRGNDMSCLLINDCRLKNASIKIDFINGEPKLSLVKRGEKDVPIAINDIEANDDVDINAILNSITINVHDIERSTNMKFEKIATELKGKDRGEVEGAAMTREDVQGNTESTDEAIKKAMKNVKKDLIQVRE
ncbi:hypothetical protein N8772_00885 [Rickettsiales bacterium]|nr:hypothetical protein [Rickettsiales bacterium]